MGKNITWLGNSYTDVGYVDLPQTGGGTAFFHDVSETTAEAEDVAQGKLFLTSDGTLTTGTASGGSANLVPYALRPDAELVTTFTYDKLLVQDEGIAMPAYSTSAKTLKASANLSPTITLDPTNYNYVVAERLLAYPIYADGTIIVTGRFEYWLEAINYDIVEIPSGTFKSMADPSKTYTSRINAIFQGGAFFRELYWSSASALTTYSTTAYGIYMTATSPQINGNTLTIKSPALAIRGHTTYLRSTVWNTFEDIRYQYIIELYRSPKGNLNLDGWGDRQGALHIIDCVDNGGTLT